MFVDALLGNSEEKVQQLKERVEKIYNVVGRSSSSREVIGSSGISTSPSDRLKAVFNTETDSNNKPSLIKQTKTIQSTKSAKAKAAKKKSKK